MASAKERVPEEGRRHRAPARRLNLSEPRGIAADAETQEAVIEALADLLADWMAEQSQASREETDEQRT